MSETQCHSRRANFLIEQNFAAIHFHYKIPIQFNFAVFVNRAGKNGAEIS